MKAKSDLLVEDVSAIVEVGLQLFQISENKLYAQVNIWFILFLMKFPILYLL